MVHTSDIAQCSELVAKLSLEFFLYNIASYIRFHAKFWAVPPFYIGTDLNDLSKTSLTCYVVVPFTTK